LVRVEDRVQLRFRFVDPAFKFVICAAAKFKVAVGLVAVIAALRAPPLRYVPASSCDRSPLAVPVVSGVVKTIENVPVRELVEGDPLAEKSASAHSFENTRPSALVQTKVKVLGGVPVFEM
jgi:hypothetical protein